MLIILLLNALKLITEYMQNMKLPYSISDFVGFIYSLKTLTTFFLMLKIAQNLSILFEMFLIYFPSIIF